EAAGEALALGVLERRGAGAGDGVDALRDGERAGEDGADHALHDQAIIVAAAPVGVAVTLDQPGAFGDFEGELARARGGLGDQAEPGLESPLLFVEAVTVRAPAP